MLIIKKVVPLKFPSKDIEKLIFGITSSYRRHIRRQETYTLVARGLYPMNVFNNANFGCSKFVLKI